MVQLTAQVKGEFELLDEGAYPATLTNVEVVEKRDTFSEDPNAIVTQFQWQWVLDTDAENGSQLRSWSRLSFHPSSNTAKSILPALGIPVPKDGDPVDTDEWLGKQCLVQVQQYVKQNGTTGNKIASYMPLPKRKLF